MHDKKNPCSNINQCDIENVFCFFDIKDSCIAYKYVGEGMKYLTNKHMKDIVDKGEFKLRSEYCPLGRDCEMIWTEHRRNLK